MDENGYGSRPSEFMVGERVALHPETRWGAQTGLVQLVGTTFVHVRLEGTAAVIMVRPNKVKSAPEV